jgi:FtsP/CotA-like multicopper oxidase with cupredoxin domain
MSYFDLRIPGLPMTVVAADGQPVHPVTVDELRIALAETVDVIVEPRGQDAYTIFAQALDRSGYARGTLALRPSLEAPVPALDTPALLTMFDMGQGGHAGHGGAAAAAAGAHAGHAGHVAQGPAPTIVHPATESGNPGVDMQVASAAPRLDDPDGREPGRELELHLTGHMERFV